jgi:hypothetical protein
MKKLTFYFLLFLFILTILILVLVHYFKIEQIAKYNFDTYYKKVAENCGFPYSQCIEVVQEMSKNNEKTTDKNGNCPDSYFESPVGYMCYPGRCPEICMSYSQLITDIKVCDNLDNTNGENIFSKEGLIESLAKEQKNSGINESTRNVDFCIFEFVNSHKEVTEKNICDRIISSYYKDLCNQNITNRLSI